MVKSANFDLDLVEWFAWMFLNVTNPNNATMPKYIFVFSSTMQISYCKFPLISVRRFTSLQNEQNLFHSLIANHRSIHSQFRLQEIS